MPDIQDFKLRINSELAIELIKPFQAEAQDFIHLESKIIINRIF